MDCFGLSVGAEGETRTPTGEPPLDPEPSVSTNSTTSARKEKYLRRQSLASVFLQRPGIFYTEGYNRKESGKISKSYGIVKFAAIKGFRVFGARNTIDNQRNL